MKIGRMCAGRRGPARLLERDIKPADIMTRQAFENAMCVTIALGGSTNAVLHLLAMARSVGLTLTLDDFQAVSDRTPLLADLKPSGRFVMEDLHQVGGTPAVMKLLLDAGLLHGDCLTVTGRTLAQNLAALPGLAEGQEIIRPLDNPIKPTGHIQILRGNLAPDGAVAKITGKEGGAFPARHGFLTRKRRCWPPWSSSKFGKGMWWSSAMRGRRAARGCRRC
jgi:dihydroxy-acid dehydratase